MDYTILISKTIQLLQYPPYRKLNSKASGLLILVHK